MPQAGLSRFGIHLYRNHVEAVIAVMHFMFVEIAGNYFRELAIFAASDGHFRRRGRGILPARLYLDENYLLIFRVAGDHVNFSHPVAEGVLEIRFQDFIAVILQIVHGNCLSKFSDIVFWKPIHIGSIAFSRQQKNRPDGRLFFYPFLVRSETSGRKRPQKNF